MKRIVFVIGFFLSTIFCFSQDMKTFNLYKPDDNAKEKISDAVKEAKKSDKHVLLQIGGNWCKENYNTELLKKYKFPQRFGFPVFLILNEEGDLIHTQNSEYLESGNGYDKGKVTAFFNNWSKKALDSSNYKEQ